MMTVSIFFVVTTALLLICALFVMRSREPRLRSFGIAGSLTALLLLAGAIFRLTDPVIAGSEGLRLMNAITVGNLSATSVLLIGWTASLR